MVEAARPFRAGTRFQALPDVRFLVDGGRIRAPGDLLPGPQDITAQRYGERLDHQMGGRGRLLVVEQPLILDHTLWAQVRSLVAPLWDRAGYPVLPVVTELVLGERITECDGPAHEPRHSTLTWVLHGTVTAAPRDATAGPTLTAGAGDLLHWPAGRPHRMRFASRTLAMRLLVPRDPRLLNAGAKDLVAALMDRQRGRSRVPYLPFPAGEVPSPPDIPELGQTAELLREMTATPHLNHALSAVWAQRVSAAALEPAPGPRPPARLSPNDRLRPASTVMRMPLDDGKTWLWAIDGHAFRLRGTLGERVLNRLRQGDFPTVRQLCAVAGPDGEALVLALLEKLYTLRGVDVDVDVDGQENTA
ncbi:hypothetical protein [Streptomyces sp. AK04-3B]|uniref:cupin domain-containing protein n=1 Tax=unclassified Streptomyces TaxID=2593676 RepID=UPI0029BD0311|nr:hypothetical protein [Streptomyces sp. AK04-3B]MDX3802217.1 hypothetical protein [Streptomyces sp. AK04-3B]